MQQVPTRSLHRQTVRVLTYNVRHCRGVDGRVDLRRTAGVISSAAPDVAGLQELDACLERSGTVDQPLELGRSTGLRIGFCSALSLAGGRYGIGIGSREGAEARCLALPRWADEEPRVAAWLPYAGMTFLTAHLSLEGPARRSQMDFLATIAAGLDPPVVVLGDLNTGRRGLAPLLAAGFKPGRRHLTHSSTFPRHQIDWVLAGPGARITSSWTLRTAASDHRPLVAVVERER